MDGIKQSFENYFLNPVLKNYANSHGRIRRREYWSFVLWYFLINLVLVILCVLATQLSQTLGGILWVVLLLLNIALIVPSVCMEIRRLHDIGQSGFLILLNLLGLGIVLVILNLLDSQPGENKYGPNPKGQ
jgi:uncharacterized membrane protein YhaH (DUF805 family)